MVITPGQGNLNYRPNRVSAPCYCQATFQYGFLIITPCPSFHLFFSFLSNLPCYFTSPTLILSFLFPFPILFIKPFSSLSHFHYPSIFSICPSLYFHLNLFPSIPFAFLLYLFFYLFIAFLLCLITFFYLNFSLSLSFPNSINSSFFISLPPSQMFTQCTVGRVHFGIAHYYMLRRVTGPL